MGRRRDAVLTLLDAADGGDLRADLGAWQDAAVAGLRPLRQLDLDHFYLVAHREAGEFLGVESAVRRPAAEIAGADLPDDVAAAGAVVGAEAPFAGVVGEAAEARALVEGENGVGAQRPEAHGGDVQHRHRIGPARNRGHRRQCGSLRLRPASESSSGAAIRGRRRWCRGACRTAACRGPSSPADRRRRARCARTATHRSRSRRNTAASRGGFPRG